jgi:hypothetical protein
LAVTRLAGATSGQQQGVLSAFRFLSFAAQNHAMENFI